MQLAGEAHTAHFKQLTTTLRDQDWASGCLQPDTPPKQGLLRHIMQLPGEAHTACFKQITTTLREQNGVSGRLRPTTPYNSGFPVRLQDRLISH
jgi:hypothetical protein